jgi:beta-lactam-binding protein with PASTA domain
MQYLQAETKLRKQGLEPQVSFIIGNASDDHLVLRQKPTALTLVTQGDTVYLTVSSGPRQEMMPYVLGQTLVNATAKLRSEGFLVHVVHEATTDPALLGSVANQSPQSGSDYAQGTVVTLTVYKGQVTVEVPVKFTSDVPELTARNALFDAGFQVVLGRSTYSPNVPKNWVITTYPRPGKYEVKGSAVQLIISLGPEAIVPNVTDPVRTENGAIRVIQRAGLAYQVVPVTTQGYLPGYVTSQSPSPGTPESPGSIVTIDVEQEPATTTTTTTTTIAGPTGTTGPTGVSGIG